MDVDVDLASVSGRARRGSLGRASSTATATITEAFMPLGAVAVKPVAGFDLSSATELAPARARDEGAPEGAVAISTPSHELVVDFGDAADAWLAQWVNGVPAAAVHPTFARFVSEATRASMEHYSKLPGAKTVTRRDSVLEQDAE